MDVQRTVPYRNPGSGSGNLHLLTVDQEIRKRNIAFVGGFVALGGQILFS